MRHTRFRHEAQSQGGEFHAIGHRLTATAAATASPPTAGEEENFENRLHRGLVTRDNCHAIPIVCLPLEIRFEERCKVVRRTKVWKRFKLNAMALEMREYCPLDYY